MRDAVIVSTARTPIGKEASSVIILSRRQARPVAVGEKPLAFLGIGDASRCVQL